MNRLLLNMVLIFCIYSNPVAGEPTVSDPALRKQALSNPAVSKKAVSDQAPGEKIVVHCQGNGQLLYLIVGGPAFTSKHLEPIQQQLQDNFRVCRWDMRGVGENAALPIKEDKTVIDQWLQDMAEVMPEQPVILWGQSWGALQSLLFANRYPERVKAIVLSNPVDPELASIEDIEIKRYLHPYVESKITIDDMDTEVEKRHRLRSKIASYFLDAEQGWDYSAQFDHDDTNSQLNVQAWQEYRQNPLTLKDLRLLSTRITAAIYCRQDVLMPENYQHYSSALPTVKHHLIDGCAHYPWEEQSAEYYELLQQSLAD